MARKTYRPSPIGIARYCWVNKPDTKYNQDGLYHTDLIVEGAEAEAEVARLTQEADEAFEAFVKAQTEAGKMKPAEAKKWGIHLPFEDELDGDGKPTGRTIFKYKQNVKIPLPDGSFKTFKMGIRDAKNKEINEPVYGGATIRTLYAPRAIPMNSLKKLGLRLDFCMVQLIKPANVKGGGFDEVEGGYVDEADHAAEGTEDGAEY